jgi:hypothetical protein
MDGTNDHLKTNPLERIKAMNHYEPFQAAYRSDRRTYPAKRSYRYLTVAEVKALQPGSRVKVLDQNGRVAEVKITSIKTWKTRPDVQIGWKFGMYEFGRETFRMEDDNFFFVTEC